VLIAGDAQGTEVSKGEQEREKELQNEVVQAMLPLLEDPEPRVCLALGEYLGILASKQGTAVWERTRDSVLGSIERNWVSSTALFCCQSCCFRPIRARRCNVTAERL
jgi:hypothetical protein